MSKTVSQTSSLTVQPSGYTGNSGTISSIANGYNSASNTSSYAQFTVSTSSTPYLYYTFDLSSIPSDATINSVNCTVRYNISKTSTSLSAAIQLYSGTTAKGSSTTSTSTTSTTYSLTCGDWTRSELDDLKLYVYAKYSGRNSSTYYLYFYGADLTISYTYNETVYVVTISSSGDGAVSPTGEQEIEPGNNLDITLTPNTGVISTSITDNNTDVTSQLSSNIYSLSNINEDHTIVVTYISTTYNISATITNGTILSPSDNPTSVPENNSITISFKGDDDKTFKYMKVNGEEVTPTITTASSGQDSTTATYSYETNYGIYSTYYLSQAFDGSESDYFWSSEAQASGKYILITFNKFINLTAFSTYSSSSTDYPNTCNELQCSTDGTNWTSLGTFQASQTSSFSNLSTGNIKYIRIYATSTISNWLVINTITMTYTTPEISDTTDGYSYTISNVTEDKVIEIRFSGNDGVFIKLGTTWK